MVPMVETQVPLELVSAEPAEYICNSLVKSGTGPEHCNGYHIYIGPNWKNAP